MSLKDHIRNDEIRRRTNVEDVISRTASIKCSWVGQWTDKAKNDGLKISCSNDQDTTREAWEDHRNDG